MSDESTHLLLVLCVPDPTDMDDDPEYADALADCFVSIINDERRRNGGRQYKPVTINAIPGPQLLSNEGLARLVAAIRAVAS